MKWFWTVGMVIEFLMLVFAVHNPEGDEAGEIVTRIVWLAAMSLNAWEAWQG